MPHENPESPTLDPGQPPPPTHLSPEWARVLDEACQPRLSAWSRPGTQVPNPTDLTRFDAVARMADSEDCWSAVRDRLKAVPATVLRDFAGALVRHLPTSLSPSLYLAQHPDPGVRERMTVAARAIDGTRTATLLLAVMEQTEDPSVRKDWYDMLSRAYSVVSQQSIALSVAMARALALQIEWQERHPGLGIPTESMHRCVAAIARQTLSLPGELEVSTTLARWLADTACQKLPYLGYDVMPTGGGTVSRETDLERRKNSKIVARMAANTLANGNIRDQEALYETAVHISAMPERNIEDERGVIPPRGAMLAAGATCLAEAGVPDRGCVDLDVAESFVQQCTDGDDYLRQILTMSLMAHLLRRPEDRPRALGLIVDLVAVPPDEIRGNLTSQLLVLLLRALGTDGFLDRPNVRRVYETAAEIWTDVAIEVIARADPAVLKRLTGVWLRRKKEFPLILEALVKRGVPVLTNDQALRLVQSSSIDRTQAILATSLTIDEERRPSRKPAASTAPRKL